MLLVFHSRLPLPFQSDPKNVIPHNLNEKKNNKVFIYSSNLITEFERLANRWRPFMITLFTRFAVCVRPLLFLITHPDGVIEPFVTETALGFQIFW
jgi:hypothetical protein